MHRRLNGPAAARPSSAPTGRRLLRVPGESGAVVQGVGLTRRVGPCARLDSAAEVVPAHHRLPPRRTDAGAQGTGRVTPPTGTGRAVSPFVGGPRAARPTRPTTCTVVRMVDRKGNADAQQ
jgi:hypothetical protein